MTGAELEDARKRLGLTAAQLGRALELTGRDPGRDVRRWETGALPSVPGPVRVAVRYMLAEAARHRVRQAPSKAEAIYAPRPVPPPDRVEPVPGTVPPENPERRSPSVVQGRRRGFRGVNET